MSGQLLASMYIESLTTGGKCENKGMRRQLPLKKQLVVNSYGVVMVYDRLTPAASGSSALSVV